MIFTIQFKKQAAKVTKRPQGMPPVDSWPTATGAGGGGGTAAVNRSGGVTSSSSGDFVWSGR